jgi:ribosome-associated protein
LHDHDRNAMTEEISLSRTQRKKQMTALQELGAELVLLNPRQLAEMELPETLREAVLAAQQITRFEARRRQLQYIGRLMREVDAEPIRAWLDRWKTVSREHVMRLHGIERWRERLLVDAAAMGEFARAYPQADLQQLRAIVRNAKREREHDEPPRSYRALFRMLQEIVNGEWKMANREQEMKRGG